MDHPTPEDTAKFILAVQDALNEYCDAGASHQHIAQAYGGSLRTSMEHASDDLRDQIIGCFRRGMRKPTH